MNSCESWYLHRPVYLSRKSVRTFIKRLLGRSPCGQFFRTIFVFWHLYLHLITHNQNGWNINNEIKYTCLSPCLFLIVVVSCYALYGKETFSISVQFHLQVHRWCIVHKQPRIRKLSGPDVSCWTWDQGHHREHDFCFLPRFTSLDWEGWSTSHFHLRQARLFQFPHHKNFRSWVVIFHHRRPMACLSLNLYDTPGLAPRMNFLFWGPGDFPVSYSNRDTLWNAWNRHSGSFMVDTGILLSNME